MRTIITTALSLAILGISSCKKIDDTINKTKSQGSLSATVNGKSYTAGATTISFGAHTLWLKGTNFSNDEELSISLSDYDASKTKYALDFINNTADYKDGGSVKLHASTGELELQRTGNKSAKGTFNFETQDGIKVTNGNFDVSWD